MGTQIDNNPSHFGDKLFKCTCCSKNVLIKFNQIGGFWHLNGYQDKQGNKYFGGYCSGCFDKVRK